MKKSKNTNLLLIVIVLCSLLIFVNCAIAYGESSDKECLSCHANEAAKLSNSSHGKVSCIKCHSNLDIGKHPPDIPENTTKTVDTACDRCHPKVAEIYIEGVHGNAGKYERLACNSCHGGHTIVGINAPASPVSPQNINTTCKECHRGQLIQNYNGGMHGRAAVLGSKAAPDCIGCHSSHGIKKVTGNNGGIETTAVTEMYEKCHHNAGTGLAEGREHTPAEPTGLTAPRYWVGKFFAFITVASIGGFVLHIQAELFRYVRSDRRKEEKDGEKDDRPRTEN